MEVTGLVVLGLGVGIKGPSMWLCGFNACTGSNMDTRGA